MEKYMENTLFGTITEIQANKAKFELCDSKREAIYNENLSENFKIGDKVAVCGKCDNNNVFIVRKVNADNEIVEMEGEIKVVNQNFGYIKTEEQDTIYFSINNLYRQRKPGHSRNKTDLNSFLEIGDKVWFSAVSTENSLRIVSVKVLRSTVNSTSMSAKKGTSKITFPSHKPQKQLSREEGIIVFKAPKFVHLWSKNLGLVFCPSSELNTNEQLKDHQNGSALSFIPVEQEAKNGFCWMARKAIHVKIAGKVAVYDWGFQLESVNGIVGNVTKNTCVAWNEQVGLVTINRQNIDNFDSLKPFTPIKLDIAPIAYRGSQDNFWLATKIEIQSKEDRLGVKSYREEKGRLHQVYHHTATFTLSGGSKAFLSSANYYKQVGGKLDFNREMQRHTYYHLLVVPHTPSYSATKWTIIFAQPWNLKEERKTVTPPLSMIHTANGTKTLLDLENNDVLNQVETVELSPKEVDTKSTEIESDTSSSTENLTDWSAFEEELDGCFDETLRSETTEMETQTCKDLMIEWPLFKSIRDNPVLWDIVRRKHRSLLIPIVALLKGAHRNLNYVRFVPDLSSASCDSDLVTDAVMNMSVQTAVNNEKIVINELSKDEEFCKVIEEETNDLWIDCMTNFLH